MKPQTVIWKAIAAATLTLSAVFSAINLTPVTANPSPKTQQLNQVILTLSGHTAPVRAIALSPDGQILASGGDDETIKLWNPKTGALIATVNENSDRVQSLAISPDGQILASASYDKTIKLWNPKTGKLLRTLSGHTNQVRSVFISPDGKTLASTSYDKTIKLWNLKTGKLIRSLKPGKVATALVISPDSKTLFNGNEDATIQSWNISTGKLLRTLTPPRPVNPFYDQQRASGVISLAISPDGQTLINGGYDDTHQSLQQTDGKNVKVWNVKTGKLIHNFSVGIGSVDAIVISPDSKTFATGGLSHIIQLWNVKTGKLVNELKGHAGGVYALALSRDGKTLISGSGDKSIKVWQVSP
ncbi:serine/threonine protein kinase with WD-40 repeats [Calothrix sp. NIES-2100]|uniref:WD40 repeat domain-containing protein n=1 Tax=Calothrix sp. NIES-2100 TaxID=1954172 RepID=UPI000B6004C3|nr:serine/threonine protein kinase with WD-40 repeats [Calothrix sp. NIES-2100]